MHSSTLVIKTLTELVEFVRKLDEKMKAMLRETKENVQGTNSDAKETGIQINGVDQKEERNIEPEKNEETRIRKNEERLRNLQDILKRSWLGLELILWFPFLAPASQYCFLSLTIWRSLFRSVADFIW